MSEIGAASETLLKERADDEASAGIGVAKVETKEGTTIGAGLP